MKVAYLNREPSAYPGGDVLSINETIDALATLGVEAKYLHGRWTPADLAPFDLVHVKHVNFGWSKFNFEQVWASGRPYVVQPVFYPRTDLGMNDLEIRRALDVAETVIPYTWAEWVSIREMTDASTKRVHCIPNGTSPAFNFLERNDGLDPERPVDVLCVSPREGKGETVAVRDICRRRGWAFRNVTGAPYHEMPQHYRDAKVFVSATDGDRMSRTVGEALCAGCRVISSDKNLGNTYYPGLWVYPYGDTKDLEAAITGALVAGALTVPTPWDFRPNTAARRLTWETVALLLRVVYLEALG